MNETTLRSGGPACPIAKIEDATFARITRRIIPLVFIAYLLAYLDRINIGYAQLQMKSALDFSDAVYGFGAGVFFISYLLLEIPSNLLFERIGARLSFLRIMVLWGAASVAMMFVRTPMHFYILRFLLGVFEAGFFPGVILYLSYWYPSAQRAKVTGLFLFSLPVAGVLGGPLSGWVLGNMNGLGGLGGWQWLFLLEGLPSIVFGIVWYYLSSNGPNDARWLSAEEKQIVTASLSADEAASTGHGRLKDAFADKRVYVLGMIFFTNFCGVYTFSFWLPTIIKSMGVSDVAHIGALSLIPYAFGALGMLLISRSSDVSRERRLHIALPSIVGALALSGSTVISTSLTLSLIMLCVAAFSIMGAATAFWAVPPTYLTNKARAPGIALISSLGALGGFVSPTLIGIVRTYTGSLTNGLYFMSFLLCVGALMALVALPADALRVGRLPDSKGEPLPHTDGLAG
ncbi:MFS transporter [Paraburkholderia sp. DGU8]|uniref:MFS transporter n=1 Tax=Paraburkholderia sp. DGU8 TaxID=3161997 RepID=UPI00346782D1